MSAFWVVTVVRATGAVSAELVEGKDAAYQRALEVERDPAKASFVVRRVPS